MKATIFSASLIPLLVCLATNLTAAEETLQLTAFPQKSRLLVGEPLIMNVALTNIGRTDVQIVPFAEAFQVFLGRAGSELRLYHTKPEMSVKSRSQGKVLSAGGSFTIRLPILLAEAAMLPGTTRSNESYLVLSDPGDYEVQVKYGALATSRILVTVEEAPFTESEPWNLIRTNHLVALAMQFPEHRLPSILIQEITGVLRANPDSAYWSYLAACLPAPVGGITNTPPTMLQQVTSELMAVRYDVRGFQRDNPAAAKEHLEKVMLLHDQMGSGAITREELDRRRADLLRQYIIKYSTPLSVEEWNRRSEEYAREDTERARQQQLDLQRYAIEADRILRDKPK